jgi:hypothetical protein
MERTSFTLAAALGGAMLAGVPTLAWAQSAPHAAPRYGSFSDMLGMRGRTSPPIGRYAAEGMVFVFDRQGGAVQFEGAREIVVLRRQPAPRGGDIYVNDLGEPVLRIGATGGMTLFTPERPHGVPAAFVATAPPMRLEQMKADIDMLRVMRSVSAQITRVMGFRRQVSVEAPDMPPATWPVLADVLFLTHTAFLKNAARERSKSKMRHIDTILVQQGAAPAVRVEGDVLRITITPARGVAGRPSSEKIARALVR